jgi:hypothetical protein
MPLVARPMYRALGIGWATSLLGFVALALAGIPVLFMIYGTEYVSALDLTVFTVAQLASSIQDGNVGAVARTHHYCIHASSSALAFGRTFRMLAKREPPAQK